MLIVNSLNNQLAEEKATRIMSKKVLVKKLLGQSLLNLCWQHTLSLLHTLPCLCVPRRARHACWILAPLKGDRDA